MLVGAISFRAKLLNHNLDVSQALRGHADHAETDLVPLNLRDVARRWHHGMSAVPAGRAQVLAEFNVFNFDLSAVLKA